MVRYKKTSTYIMDLKFVICYVSHFTLKLKIKFNKCY